MVKGKRGAGMTAELSDGRHEWLSGLDAAAGGQDEAPDPHRLLEGALAACTILTVQLYAARKGWPLERAHAEVEITQEGAEGNRLRRRVRFEGPLTDEQRARLLDIANKCPIHRFLTRPTAVDTELAP